jgi:hypothetical protein
MRIAATATSMGPRDQGETDAEHMNCRVREILGPGIDAASVDVAHVEKVAQKRAPAK